MSRPRSLWNGTIAFGAVAIPVKLFAATEDHRIHFREVRLSDGCRIEHRLVGADSGREIRRANTMAETEQVAIGRIVMRSREQLVAVRERDGLLALSTMLSRTRSATRERSTRCRQAAERCREEERSTRRSESSRR